MIDWRCRIRLASSDSFAASTEFLNGARERELAFACRVALATLASAREIACWLDWSWRSTELRS